MAPQPQPPSSPQPRLAPPATAASRPGSSAGSCRRRHHRQPSRACSAGQNAESASNCAKSCGLPPPCMLASPYHAPRFKWRSTAA
eukprot:1814824-Pleurochrysis_carterae.AAC.3